MSEQENLLANIEAYLNGEMPPEQHQAFEQQIATDQQVSAELEAYQETIAALKTHQFKNHLKANHQEYKRSATSSKRRLYYISGIAASLLLLLTFSYLFLQPTSSSELYANYFEPYPNLQRTRGNNDQFDQALKLYTQEDYKQAIQAFKALPSSIENKNQIQFYTAISYLVLEQTQEAIELLKAVDAKSLYLPQARWYLAMCYLKLDDKSNVLSHLSFIKEGDFMYKEAQEIISKL